MDFEEESAKFSDQPVLNTGEELNDDREEKYFLFDTKVPVCATHKVSIIVPTHNDSHHITTTMGSILQQRNVRFEVIVIDAQSQDRTIDIIRSYEDPRVRIQSAPTPRIFEMLNRGVAMAQGDYINILLPGDSYLHPEALSLAVWQISEFAFPDIFYAACFVRDEWYEPHFLFRPLRNEYLRQGLQPTHLQSLWIKKSVFKEIGYFDTSLKNRGALDFLIRFARHSKFMFSSEMRVFVDPEVLKVSYSYLMSNFYETIHVIMRHYGIFWATLWLFKQKEGKRLLLRFLRHLKKAFQGKPVQ